MLNVLQVMGKLMKINKLVSVYSLLLLAACAQDPAPSAAAQSAAIAPGNGDPGKGQRIYIQCQACHTLDAGGAHKVGPNLAGLEGKVAASADGFNYSAPLTESEIVWDAETLDKWIERPSDFVPGTTMVFAGLPDAEDRANLIAYLLQETSQ